MCTSRLDHSLTTTTTTTAYLALEMACIPENGVVVSVHAHSVRQHLLLVVQKRVGAEIVCEIGTLVDPAAFDRTPRPGGSISLGVHRCVRGPRLRFDPTPRDAERRKSRSARSRVKLKSAGALLRSNNSGGGGGGEHHYLA